MTVFDTSKHLCSWASLTPQNAESAGKKKTTRIGKSGVYLKPLLIQVALAASRSKKHPEIYRKKLNLQKRCGKKKAIIAIARRLLTAIYHILKKSESYHPAAYIGPLKNEAKRSGFGKSGQTREPGGGWHKRGLGLSGFVQHGHDEIKAEAAFGDSVAALDGVVLAGILVHLALEFRVRFIGMPAARRIAAKLTEIIFHSGLKIGTFIEIVPAGLLQEVVTVHHRKVQ